MGNNTLETGSTRQLVGEDGAATSIMIAIIGVSANKVGARDR